MTKAKKKTIANPRGRRPTEAMIKNMAAKGYVLVAEAAKLAKVAPTTMYGWIERKVFKAAPKMPKAVVKEGINVWVHRDALIAAIKRMNPAALDAA